ncbi:NAD(P)-binding domain-containing protein [Pseudomonas aeruginosa]|nr:MULTISPECIES: NAD(P)-binding domain-containing protein [Pseudomonas]AHB56064.1 oxidoreductase [Pseudomonas aeruginosa MTB-1]ERV29143.1 dehydrogenase [Pseudomonas aeruginosa BL16]ERV89632.1 dehydrogenase [Pseudomonas aeruginosa BWHPSA027]ETV16705.1 dehydrogenase [Pseudomonas aeruginosa BWHPSA044]EVT85953.1 oxidoreductase [Pseudomonas aeruginosa VRFPA09]EZO65072.1 dehydrogenase [Pseudomonas aeruginosa BWH058]SAJ31235.1 2-(hydroxymethyl)glutarate dehydrogenase [Enterobacter cloacae]
MDISQNNNQETSSVREHNDESVEFEVSVIGLGAMGTIMAQALLRQGRRVAIWNRSPGKAAALVAAGAHLCESAEAALAASPATIFVLLDNQATREVLGMPGVMQALANRTIVDYTTNAQDEGLALQSLVNRAGGHYVKGMIVAYPRNVGRRESHSIHTGDPEAFERHRALLEGLAGHTTFLPWDEALAFATVLHAHAFAAMVAFFEAVGAGVHFGLPPSKTARLMLDTSRFFVADALEEAVRRLEAQDFAGDQARLDVHAQAFAHIAGALHAQGAWTPVFDALCQAVQRAAAMGYGDQDIVAVTRLFARECDTASAAGQ